MIARMILRVHSNVLNVVEDLLKSIIFLYICDCTLERSHINVANVLRHLDKEIPLLLINELTMPIAVLNAVFVTWDSQVNLKSKGTLEHTYQKRQVTLTTMNLDGSVYKIFLLFNKELIKNKKNFKHMMYYIFENWTDFLGGNYTRYNVCISTDTYIQNSTIYFS